MLRCSSMSTAFDEVEPPSMPMTARTLLPARAWSPRTRDAVLGAELVELVAGERASGGPAASPSLALAAARR
jgi:hypothetical protein